ncbi:PrsW family intramembrane metalloprotease [Nocardiopsis sediminis]|uniref:PrsW family intramembrane metalloprotease n=1 Tax=Nocardiopsis sediminis TaxID=1778267 RepID=A0ABV8FTE4_9ACTN
MSRHDGPYEPGPARTGAHERRPAGAPHAGPHPGHPLLHVPRSQRGRAIWTVFGVLCAAGVISILASFGGQMAVFPGETLLSFVLLAVSVAIGFALLRRIRPVWSPPRGLSAACVLWGATAATGGALLANNAVHGMLSKTAGLPFTALWGPSLSAPFNEELLKLCGLALIALAAPRAFRGPVDGFVFGALVGLGFQVMENLTYALSLVIEQGATTGAGSVILSFAARVILTGWGSHWAMTAVAGTGLGMIAAAAGRAPARRLVPAVLLILLAVAMHWFFNAPLLAATPGGTLFSSMLNFVITLVVYFTVRHAYRHRMAQAFSADVAAGRMSEADARTLMRRRPRRKALRGSVGPDRSMAVALQAERLARAEPVAAGQQPAPAPG